MPADIRAAHVHSSSHRREVSSSTTCGCFYCCSTFRPDEILDWVDEDPQGLGQTARCPRCGIDSVLGDQSGYELSPDFLSRMRAHWF
jgi:hypothetical protein